MMITDQWNNKHISNVVWVASLMNISALPDLLRDLSLETATFTRLLKTRFFSSYWHVQHITGVGVMSYINWWYYLFTPDKHTNHAHICKHLHNSYIYIDSRKNNLPMITTIMNYKSKLSNITHISGYRWESCFKNILWILSACHILWSTCKHISNRVTVYSLYCHKHLSSKRQNEININCTTAHVKSTVEGCVIFLITLLISAITLQLHQRTWWQSTNITDG